LTFKQAFNKDCIRIYLFLINACSRTRNFEICNTTQLIFLGKKKNLTGRRINFITLFISGCLYIHYVPASLILSLSESDSGSIANLLQMLLVNQSNCRLHQRAITRASIGN